MALQKFLNILPFPYVVPVYSSIKKFLKNVYFFTLTGAWVGWGGGLTVKIFTLDDSGTQAIALTQADRNLHTTYTQTQTEAKKNTVV